VRVQSYCTITQAVILPSCEIGEGCRLNKVVIDRGVKIPAGLVVGEDPELDAKRFYRTDSGVVLITCEMLEKL
jgi:glucose-1-phosphate adenylyltransferase